MTDKSSGTLRADILDEKILSGIVEIRSALDRVEAVCETVSAVNERIDTVTAVGISTRCGEQGEDKSLAPLLADLGFAYERAKTNMGIGRVTNTQQKEAA